MINTSTGENSARSSSVAIPARTHARRSAERKRRLILRLVCLHGSYCVSNLDWLPSNWQTNRIEADVKYSKIIIALTVILRVSIFMQSRIFLVSNGGKCESNIVLAFLPNIWPMNKHMWINWLTLVSASVKPAEPSEKDTMSQKPKLKKKKQTNKLWKQP